MTNTVQSLNRVGFVTVAAPGTGDITVDTNIALYNTPATAGAVNNVGYKMLLFSGSDWEISKGVYTSGSTSLTRVLVESSTGALLNIVGTAQVYFLQDAADENGGRMLSEPQGRLTPTTGVPLITTAVTNAATIYYSPYKGNRAIFPDKDGFGLVMQSFSELSQALTDNTKSPAAAAAWRCYDMWLWDDAGTLRCTRGPGWTDGGRTFTVTIASPGVFTLNSHGFTDGQPVVFTTSGALPTGLTAGTVYFVITAGLTTNTFEVSATRGGSAVNTSGSQSGTHTATTYVQSRGTGAGTEEHNTTTYPGWIVNANAITNGPGALKGFYVGTILTNGSSQVDLQVGDISASGGGGNTLGIWNTYRQEDLISDNYDTSANWNYTSLTYRMKNNSIANGMIFVKGLYGQRVRCIARARSINTSNMTRFTGMALNNSVNSASLSSSVAAAVVGGNVMTNAEHVLFMSADAIGMNWFAILEASEATGTTTWAGDSSNRQTFTEMVMRG